MGQIALQEKIVEEKDIVGVTEAEKVSGPKAQEAEGTTSQTQNDLIKE